MPLSTGDKLGPYEIVAPIGAGGMGEVYKARDTRLDRTVAVKVLPDEIARREDLRARFEREARAVASLNHPNICSLFDIGPGYMVMELIDGETLADRIGKGALPLDQALKYAAQIADALDRAHRAGVTHRDVKPHNIMLTRDGVKILDFGLAKSQINPGPAEATLTKALTTEGTVMGTPQYMAPELFEGREADARADIWAFGAVLYEIVTGRKAFEGKSYSSLVGAILATDPAPMAVTPFTPFWLERLVRRCLAKDPEDRYFSMHDIVLDLRTPPPETVAAVPSKSARWPWIAASAVLALVAAATLLRPGGGAASSAQTMTLSIVLPAGQELRPPGSIGAEPFLSPDGSTVAYRTADGQIYARRLDSLEPRLLANQSNNIAFWSPDSSTLFFWSNARSGMLKVRISDGASETLWGSPGILTFGNQSQSDSGAMLALRGGEKLLAAEAPGGQLKDVEIPSPVKEGRIINPVFLPGGQDFLFLYRPDKDPDDASVYLGTLRENKLVDLVPLMKNSTPALFTPAGGGRLLFQRDDNIFSRKLNLRTRQLDGEAVLAVQSVAWMPSGNRTGGFSVARNGTIAWRRGRAAASQATEFSRSGKHSSISGPPFAFDHLLLSPDEKQLLAQNSEGSGWLLEVGRPGRTALPKDTRWFGWSADGSKLIGHRKGAIVEMSGSGAGDVRELRKLKRVPWPAVISPDGKKLVFGGSGVKALPLEGAAADADPELLVDERNTPHAPSFSPDGRWLVYGSSDVTGGLYVQPSSGPGLRRQIAPEGYNPVWRRDGRGILYRLGDALMEVSVEWGAGPTYGTPRQLFNGVRRPADQNNRSRPLSVSRDGTRIFFAVGVDQPEANVIQVKTGAFDGLR